MATLSMVCEVRQVPAQIRVEGRERGSELRIAGRAIVFDQWADVGGFMERIAPHALDDALDEADDLCLVWSHDIGTPLARRGRNMRVGADERGVWFEADLPNTQAARDAVELIRAGVVAGCSFSFAIPPGGDVWETRSGSQWRTVNQVSWLGELTLTAFPAYPQTTVEARSLVLAQGGAMATRAAPRTTVRTICPYGDGRGPHSFFRDLAVVRTDELRRQAVAGDPAYRGIARLSDGRIPEPGTEPVKLEEARQRITAALAAAEERGLGASTGAGAIFMAPGFIAEEAATAARAFAVMPTVLRAAPIPERGLDIEIPQLSAGATAAAMGGDAGTVTETDWTTTVLKVPVTLLADGIQLSQQLLDRGLSAPGQLDRFIARELGQAIAQRLDVQVLTGNGTTPNLLGILNAASTIAVSYTDASPTVPELLAPIASAYRQIAETRGAPPTAVLMAPRRWAWMVQALDASSRPLPWAGGDADLDEPMPAVRAPVGRIGELPVWVVPSIPTNRGAGTNQDCVIVLRREDVPLFTGEVSFDIFTDYAGSGSLTARAQARQYAAVAVPYPSAVAIVDGSGLVPPAGI